jgi:hypothetical protein
VSLSLFGLSKTSFTPPSQLCITVHWEIGSENCVAPDFCIGSEGCVAAKSRIGSENCIAAWLVLKSAFLSRFYIIILHLKYQ